MLPLAKGKGSIYSEKIVDAGMCLTVCGIAIFYRERCVGLVGAGREIVGWCYEAVAQTDFKSRVALVIRSCTAGWGIFAGTHFPHPSAEESVNTLYGVGDSGKGFPDGTLGTSLSLVISHAKAPKKV